MKISKSKQELARIISENGGWSDGAEFAAQDKDGEVFKFDSKPVMGASREVWMPTGNGADKLCYCATIKGWHQTILSRAEYFHLYPAPGAEGWIEWSGGECPVDKGARIDIRMTGGKTYYDTDTHWGWNADSFKITHYRLHKPEVKPEFCESVMHGIPEPESIDGLCAKVTEENKHHRVDAKPTIEQLAHDYRNKLDFANRKQDEADKANMDSDAALSQLEDAISAIGFAITPLAATDKEPELVITDWRDLRVGDEVELVIKQGGLAMVGEVGVISHAFGNGDFNVDFPSHRGYSVDHCDIKFIRRP